MKLLNKKGFILVETLVVTLFIMTLFMLVYQNLVPSIGKYEAMENYDDIDSVYASNLFKKTLLRYGNTDYIDSYLANHTYLDITDCSNINVYKNSDYCLFIKDFLDISEDDYIFITKYDIKDFRNEVKNNELFDSGKFSGFKDYISTIPDIDTFYDTEDHSKVAGKYRLFLTRTVPNIDQSNSLKYVNLGIFDGLYKRYNVGELVQFSPIVGGSKMNFYVLKNSSSLEEKVTLILDRNVGTVTAFNSTGTTGLPNSALKVLSDNTTNWNNVAPFTNSTQYVSSNGYTISYNGYRARLLEPNDIYALLGSQIDADYFNYNNLFSILLTNSSASFLFQNLTGNQGYWMANMVPSNTEMAWTIQYQKIAPAFITDHTNIGVRPVIEVSKELLG